MKKLILTLFAMLATGNMFAQKNDTIYVVFTSTPIGVDPCFVHDINKDFNPNIFRDYNRGFWISSIKNDYTLFFYYNTSIKKPENPILKKPVSFLDSVKYIDWDKLSSNMTRTQAKEKEKEIESYSKIYFIDRKEIKDGIMTLVPVVSAWH